MKAKLQIIPFIVMVFLLFAFLFKSVEKKTKWTGSEPDGTKKNPNVVFIVVDDMNGYGSLGQYPVKMPYMEALKKQATNFVNAYCNSPVCNPSRASFFSGLYPHNTGAYLNGSDAWNKTKQFKELEALPELFKRNGYTTWGRGKIFHAPMDSVREYNMWDNRPVYKGGFGPFPEKEYWFGGNRFFSVKAWEDADEDFPDVKNANAAIAFLQQQHEKPFFLYYGLWRPHSPYTAPKRFFDMYQEEETQIPPGYRNDDLKDVPFQGRQLVDSLKRYYKKGKKSETLWKKFLWAYKANTTFADWNYGRVIEALDNSRYADNTIVILFSDNGFNCGEKERWGKGTLWEQSDYVPLLIRTPSKQQATCQRTVSLLDIYPTLIEYCQLEKPRQKLDGQSLVPLLKDPDAPWDRPAFTSYGIAYASVRDERYRYIRYPDGSEELYDHKSDPYELNNIAANNSLKGIKEKLRAHIPQTWTPNVRGRLEVKR